LQIANSLDRRTTLTHQRRRMPRSAWPIPETSAAQAFEHLWRPLLHQRASVRTAPGDGYFSTCRKPGSHCAENPRQQRVSDDSKGLQTSIWISGEIAPRIRQIRLMGCLCSSV
jgi:hypothetical protein